nr:unnamed protein product [Callosobruchus analis]
MLFGRRQAQRRVIHKISIKINSVGIPLTNKTKNLGVYIDTSLTFSDHISHILRRGYSSLKSLYRSRKILSKRTKLFSQRLWYCPMQTMRMLCIHRLFGSVIRQGYKSYRIPAYGL